MHINATLFGQMITFALFVWFTMRIIWPLLITQMDLRQKSIADGLAAAERGHKILADAEDAAKRKLSEMKQHGYKILEEADREASKIIDDARLQARHEHDQIVATGNAQIARAVKQAKADLQLQIANIVVLGAEKILERTINADDHQELLQSLARKLA